MPGGKYRIDQKKVSIDNSTFQPDRVLPIRTCNDIVREASKRNLWLYDPRDKSWYSPEEFSTKFERIVAGNEKFLEKIQIRDPIDGIKGGYKRLQDIQIKLQDFTGRVLQYYKRIGK